MQDKISGAANVGSILRNGVMKTMKLMRITICVVSRRGRYDADQRRPCCGFRTATEEQLRSGGPNANVRSIKSKLSAYIQASREGPVVVTRNGKAVAVVIAVEDDDKLDG